MKVKAPHGGRRKLWIRGAVIGLAVTVGVILWAYWQDAAIKARRPSPAPAISKDVNQRLSGFTFNRSEGGHHIFTIHASRTIAFKQGGTTVLKDVYVEFFGRSRNRYDVLRTAQGEYEPSSGNLSIPGKVELVLNATPPKPAEPGGKSEGNKTTGNGQQGAQKEPLYVNTSKVTARDNGTLVESNTPVRFQLGAVSGRALGLTYASGKGQIVLKQDVQAIFHPDKMQKGGPIQLTACRLLYSDTEKRAILSGSVEIRQGARITTAEQGTVLFDANNRVTQILLRGKVKATDHTLASQMELQSDVLQGDLDPGSTQLRKLVAKGHVRGETGQTGSVARFEAHLAELDFPGNRNTPASGKAMGQVRLTIAQRAAPLDRSAGSRRLGAGISREELSAEAIRFTFQPNGKNLEGAETLDPGKLLLFPENPQAGLRTVTADKFTMSFDPHSRIEKLRGQGNTRIIVSPPPNTLEPSPSESSARQLLAMFNPATESLQSLEQTGDFHFHKGDLQAKADQAYDSALRQTLVLVGHPEVWDPTARARANRMIIHLDSNTAEATGHVHATHFESPNDPLPINVVADRMVANRETEMIHYEGQVRAWHGTDVIESPVLDLNQKRHLLSSDAGVITSHVQPAAKPAADPKQGSRGDETSALTIRADRLEYFDQEHRAHYAGKAELDTEDTRLRADVLDLYFSAPNKDSQNSQVERAVATGHVRVTQPLRYADGNRAVYDARAAKIVLTGGPPTLYDQEKGFISGQRLTFYIHDDRLQVEGGSNSPTVSKHRVAP